MSYLSICYALFGFLGKKYRHDKDLGRALNKAHMEMTPDAYVAWAATTTLIVSLVALIVGGIVAFVVLPAMQDNANQGVDPDEQSTMDSSTQLNYFSYIWLGATLITGLFLKEIRIFGVKIWGGYPAYRAKQRGKKADLYLPHASSFVAALAASNATMDDIFLALSTQRAKKIGAGYWISKMFSFMGAEIDRDVFPIISDDAASMYRDTMILGVDTLSAIQSAVDRAPSAKMAEFYQGIASTISSGGNLKLYFLNSAGRFMEDIKQDQKQSLDQLATQAEMFVTVAVAMPIFLIIILIITVWISNSGSTTGNSLSTLYLVIFAFVPLLHFMFAFMTYNTIKKFQI